MTSVSDKAREALAEAYEQAGHPDEAAAFRAGEWTCHDHPALVAMIRFEAETLERAAKVADDAWAKAARKVEIGGGYVARERASIADDIRTAIRQLKGSGDE